MKATKKNLNGTERRGAVAVEAALGLVLLVTLLLGMLEFGRALMVGQLVTNAAREGARLCVVDGTSNEDVKARVNEFLKSTLNISDETGLMIDITVEPAEGNTNPGNEVANANTGDLCQVVVSVPYEEVDFGVVRFLRNAALVGSVSMRHE